MNFGTHKRQIVDLIEVALTKDKRELIERFKIILDRSSSLLKSHRFNFRLKQLGTISDDEMTITKFGLNNARRSLIFLQDCDRHSLETKI